MTVREVSQNAFVQAETSCEGMWELRKKGESFFREKYVFIHLQNRMQILPRINRKRITKFIDRSNLK